MKKLFIIFFLLMPLSLRAEPDYDALLRQLDNVEEQMKTDVAEVINQFDMNSSEYKEMVKYADDIFNKIADKRTTIEAKIKEKQNRIHSEKTKNTWVDISSSDHSAWSNSKGAEQDDIFNKITDKYCVGLGSGMSRDRQQIRCDGGARSAPKNITISAPEKTGTPEPTSPQKSEQPKEAFVDVPSSEISAFNNSQGSERTDIAGKIAEKYCVGGSGSLMAVRGQIKCEQGANKPPKNITIAAPKPAAAPKSNVDCKAFIERAKKGETSNMNSFMENCMDHMDAYDSALMGYCDSLVKKAKSGDVSGSHNLNVCNKSQVADFDNALMNYCDSLIQKAKKGDTSDAKNLSVCNKDQVKAFDNALTEYQKSKAPTPKSEPASKPNNNSECNSYIEKAKRGDDSGKDFVLFSGKCSDAQGEAFGDAMQKYCDSLVQKAKSGDTSVKDAIFSKCTKSHKAAFEKAVADNQKSSVPPASNNVSACKSNFKKACEDAPVWGTLSADGMMCVLKLDPEAKYVNYMSKDIRSDCRPYVNLKQNSATGEFAVFLEM
jgi:hypothetical protein